MPAAALDLFNLTSDLSIASGEPSSAYAHHRTLRLHRWSGPIPSANAAECATVIRICNCSKSRPAFVRFVMADEIARHRPFNSIVRRVASREEARSDGARDSAISQVAGDWMSQNDLAVEDAGLFGRSLQLACCSLQRAAGRLIQRRHKPAGQRNQCRPARSSIRWPFLLELNRHGEVLYKLGSPLNRADRQRPVTASSVAGLA